MTVSNDVPDWRDRITPHQPNPVRASMPAHGFWSAQGVVTSELEAHWHTRAGGTRALLHLSILTYIVALTVSGQLPALFTRVTIALLPLLLLVLVVFGIAGMLPGGRFIAGAVMGAGLRGPGGVRRHPGPAAPGRQLTLTGATGEVEEVLVANSRRLPAGARIRAFGPRIFGRRHAWFVRPEAGGLVASRGVVSAMLVAPPLFALSVLTLLEVVPR
ncbi:hypothetical protein [Nocardioides kribbensis]|uniref:DUF304 domain-containing protein n=1 Tax=Nocardioides kribbensis TaxID=305517 RepID=A0ABV1NTE7_9ACTN